ncbi:MAG: DUF255 domain-containing protein [Planctomycetota bacterium]
MTEALESPKHTNALARETSPYLLQHAHNPVDWMPWGEAAFAAARERGVPIFLSVGYATCYWCHVMERESFEDEAIGRLLNERFVCVKVDREERPDVDEVYMTAVQLMTGQGGWPMSVWLTPPSPLGEDTSGERVGSGGMADEGGLLPFYAGTYFPPTGAYGRPGFAELIEGIGEAWRDRRGEVVDQAERVGEAVRNGLSEGGGVERGVSMAFVEEVADRVMRMHDPKHGGFGGAPKFPQPSWPRLLIRASAGRERKGGPRDIGVAVAKTLDAMADGGMFDQVGGGFHRYSTDAHWLVPHFEKMLYDNGQLLSLYAEGVRAVDRLASGEAEVERCRSRWSRVLRETADYVLREMVDETGALWSAQDAEVDGREGLNFLWTPAEVDAALREAGAGELTFEALRLYGLDGVSNFRDPHHPEAEPAWVVAMTGQPPRDEAGWEKRARINAALRAVRDRRKQPRVDDKLLASWNGMAVRGLVDAGVVLGETRYVEAAATAMRAVLKGLGGLDGGLRRSMRGGKVGRQPGFLEDYAFVIDGLLALHAAREHGTAEGDWLVEAERLCEAVVERFGSRVVGGYFDTLAGQSDLLVRTRGLSDGAVPSGNSQMLHNLVGLYEATGNGGYLKRAVLDARAMAGSAEAAGAGSAWWATGAMRLIEALPGAMRERLAAVGDTASGADGGVDNDEVVRVSIARAGLADGELRAELRLDIAEGYHVNGPEVGGEGLMGLAVTVARPSEAVVVMDWPATHEVAMGEGSVGGYAGVVALPVTVRGAGEADVLLALRYQACGEGVCLPPRRVGVTLSGSASS